jgi:hypothetical protein
MPLQFNPFTGNLDFVAAPISALNVLGTVVNEAALPGGATTGDVYQTEDTGEFYVWDGAAWDNLGTLVGPQGIQGDPGPAGADGANGADGAAGVGVPAGGTTGQVLGKASGDDYDTEWVDQTGGGGTPGGSDTQVQFNDGGSFAGSADLTWDDTAKELGVGGDINLDDGGTYTTTLQMVTATANRTISFPDATGTVALVAGSNQTVQFNSAGALSGDSGLLYDATTGALTVGGKTVSADAPVINLSQSWNNAAVTFTGIKLNVTDTASASASNLLDLQVGGVSQFKLNKEAALTCPNDFIFTRGATTSFRAGTTRFSTVSELGLSNNNASSPDAFIARDAANTLAQRNGTNAQTYRLYNTYTDASNYERTSITRDSSGLVIDAQKAGTGADPTNLLDVKLDGTSYFSTSSSGFATISGPNSVNSTGLILKEGFNGVSNTYIYFRNYFSQDVARISAIPGRFRFFVNDSAGGTDREIFNLIGSGHRMLLNQDLSLEWRDTAGDSWSAIGTADVGLARDSAGVVKVTNGSTGTGYIKQDPVAVSALPSAATVGAGTRGFVNDANATTFASVVAGGGANVVPVYSDGTDWRIG